MQDLIFVMKSKIRNEGSVDQQVALAEVHSLFSRYIFFYDIPKEFYLEVEESIEAAIVHESIHIVINDLEGESISGCLDIMFGRLCDNDW